MKAANTKAVAEGNPLQRSSVPAFLGAVLVATLTARAGETTANAPPSVAPQPAPTDVILQWTN